MPARIKLDENLPRDAEALLKGALVVLGTEPTQGRPWIIGAERVRISEQQTRKSSASPKSTRWSSNRNITRKESGQLKRNLILQSRPTRIKGLTRKTMYTPEHSKETDPERPEAPIRDYPLGMLITGNDGLPCVNHIPSELKTTTGPGQSQQETGRWFCGNSSE